MIFIAYTFIAMLSEIILQVLYAALCSSKIELHRDPNCNYLHHIEKLNTEQMYHLNQDKRNCAQIVNIFKILLSPLINLYRVRAAATK